MGERPHVSFLERVLCFGVVSQNVPGHVVKTPVMPAHQDSIQGCIAGPNALDNVFIGNVCEIHVLLPNAAQITVNNKSQQVSCQIFCAMQQQNGSEKGVFTG